jgi:hypothetical protein
MLHVAMGVLCGVLGQAAPPVLGTPAPPVDPLTGGKFTAALDAPLSGSWVNAELRTLLSRIAETRRTALFLDRRLDPNRVLTFDSTGKTLRESLVEIVEPADAAMTQLGSTVVLAPIPAAGRLRTLAQLRVEELSAVVAGAKGTAVKPRLLSMAERRTLRWNDLDEPKSILELIATRWKLTIDGLDRVPHDLWAGGVLADVNASEALTIVLNGFDLTFEWLPDASGVRLVPVPETVTLERRYAPPRTVPLAEAIQKWTSEIPGLDAEADGKEIRIRGTLEQHEAVAALLKPGAKSTTGSKPTKPVKGGPVPLARRTFTLKTRDAPASAILDKLKQSGLDIRYDAKQLREDGVDLSKTIALDLSAATTRELFDAICKPIGARFVVDGEMVKIFAK